ncbi:MAG: hypothetical protein M3419_12375 [Actinomycetota bacterium]|nr:hypothetical protein [Actinomycetota bacterium]
MPDSDPTDLERHRRDEHGVEFLERSHPASPHLRLVALVLVLGLVASSGYIVLSLLFAG